MTELLTAAQMRAIEAAAIASGEVTGLDLMECAGRGVVEAIFEEWPELAATSHRAVVLCGPGNNGGDGFVVARLLKEWGWEVEVFLYGDPEKLPPDARVNYERWRGLGEVVPISAETGSLFWRYSDYDRPDIWIDSLFGIGLSRPIPAVIGKLMQELQDSFSELVWRKAGRIVAIDIPTGLVSDTGTAWFERPTAGKAQFLEANGTRHEMSEGRPFEPFWCALTVTFQREKHGHRIGQGPKYCGRIQIADIGLPLESCSLLRLVDVEHFKRRLQKIAFDGAHKYSHGHALILSGPSGRGGAARLAARGALRIGAGVVTVGCPMDATPENAARLDAVMLRGVADGAALAGVLEDERINALCLGPGMGAGDREVGLLAAALELPTGGPPPPSPPHKGEGGRSGPGAAPDDQALPLPLVGRGEGRGARRLVLDADALTILSEQPDLFAALHDQCALTPHAGEFARLFPDIAARLAEPATKGPAYSKVDATREAAKRAGCTVLYKGPDTVIADPNGRCAINSAHYDRAAPWLATAGSGDVLAGFITGLLARGFSPFDAACTGAWLHVECARSFGPGLIAEDLPEELPKVFRALGI